jgi:aminoglycoside phosphotransferase (APT) family kinase protein
VAALLEGPEEGRLVVAVAATRMHEQELEVDVPLVRRLLAEQFPHWAELPLERVLPAGTDNTIFRLGQGMSVRLPRIEWARGQPELEDEWLPRLASHLPLPVPRPLALGEPGQGYPYRWALHTWLPGRQATPERLDLRRAAVELAGLVTALNGIEAAGAPQAGRGLPLAPQDEATRRSIAKLRGLVDTDALTRAWEAALAAPAWDGPPVWVHGDLDSRNLLAHERRLSGLLDFSCMGVGDPACDVALGWKLFSGESREVFRAELAVDDATWARARGWAVSQSVNALSYYTLANNAVLVLEARRWLTEVLADPS